jgi:hypothetical protein
MIADVFGRPEHYGVVLQGEPERPTRRVHVMGHVRIEIDIDECFDVGADESDSAIKQAAIEAAGITFDTRGDVDSYLDIEDETKEAEIERERGLLAAWNRGEPIRED